MDTLPPIYWEQMLGGVTSSFADLVTVGGLVEEGLKSEKIVQEVNPAGGAKRFGSKKKEGEASAIFNKRKGPRQSGRNAQKYVATVAPVINAHNTGGQAHQQTRAPRMNNYQPRDKLSFDPIPMKYSQLYPALIQRGLVTPRGYKTPPPNPLPAWYDPQKHCEFHEGAPGHDLDNCYALKIKVQELIKADILSFKDTGPNVKTNPLPNHGGPSVSMVEIEEPD